MDDAPTFDMAMLSDRWTQVHGTSDAQRLEAELVRETVEGHLLHGVATRAVAVRRLEKEVAFWLPVEGRWAWVHLTWAKESSPNWPSADLFDSWEALVRELRSGGRE